MSDLIWYFAQGRESDEKRDTYRKWKTPLTVQGLPPYPKSPQKQTSLLISLPMLILLRIYFQSSHFSNYRKYSYMTINRRMFWGRIDVMLPITKDRLTRVKINGY